MKEYIIFKKVFFKNLFLNIKEFKLLSKRLLEGINYINKKGIIHSDINPENIF